MTENQKLRDALQAISDIDDSTNHAADASAALGRIGRIARQALALPTADELNLSDPAVQKRLAAQWGHVLPTAEQVDDINVAESFTSVTKTAAPVGEREAFENEMRHVDVWGHRSLKKRASGNYENWQVNLMWDVWQARAAQSTQPIWLNGLTQSEVDASASVSGLTAAPVREREAFEDLIEEFEAAAIDKHDCRNPEYEFEHRAYDTACQRYDTARAALSAGDAVDAQRYRYHRAVGGQSWHEVSDPRNPKRITGALYDVATDAAMRKGQL